MQSPDLRVTESYIGRPGDVFREDANLAVAVRAVIDAAHVLAVEKEIELRSLSDDGDFIALIQTFDGVAGPTEQDRCLRRLRIRIIVERKRAIGADPEEVKFAVRAVRTEEKPAKIPLHNGHIHLVGKVAIARVQGITWLKKTRAGDG